MSEKMKDLLKVIGCFVALISWFFMFLAGIGKIVGLIEWSYFFVFFPLWFLPGLVLGLFCVVCFVYFVFLLMVVFKQMFPRYYIGKYKWKAGDKFEFINASYCVKSRDIATVVRIENKIVYAKWGKNTYEVGYPFRALDNGVDEGKIKIISAV